MNNTKRIKMLVKKVQRYSQQRIRERFGTFRVSRGEQPSKWHRQEIAKLIRKQRAWGTRPMLAA